MLQLSLFFHPSTEGFKYSCDTDPLAANERNMQKIQLRPSI